MTKTLVDYLIVGCGISGVTIARLLANKGLKVLIIDRRQYIGGLCNDFYNEDGILLHRHGGHIFHTNNSYVWSFLNKFAEWNNYQHRVLSYVDGEYHIFPPKVISSKIPFGVVCKNAEDFLNYTYGREITDKYFRGYSKKHWGVDLKDLPSEIVSRVQVRENSDTRYFTNKYQGLPIGGYTQMFNNMLESSRIKIMLNTKYIEIKDCLTIGNTIWTGGIDELFNFQNGKLSYKSRRFVYKKYNVELYQPDTVINYPNDYDFIRTLELKHATGQQSPTTVVIYEYPTEVGESYYPFTSENNNLIYIEYLENFKETYLNDKFYLLGRLANYEYLNMDTCIEKAVDLYEVITGESAIP